MRKDLELQLVKDFPEIYALYGNENSCMGRSEQGFQHDDGWYDLVYCLSKQIAEISNKYEVRIIALQVKEKFGSLKFYYSLDPERDSTRQEVNKSIRQAEADSLVTCEICGKEGSKDKGKKAGRTKVLCSECSERDIAE